MASRKGALSGFPEWSPAQRAVEQRVLDVLRRTFELHGFASLETRAVEPIEVLLRKGDIDKEVYGVHRLADEGQDGQQGVSTDEGALALHFDLTVPFARYVVQNAGQLVFPFRRYQIQKVWRGERPQEGRYREFTQADIDIVDRDELPPHSELEVALVMAEAFAALGRLGLPPATIRVNNRKLIEGFALGCGSHDAPAVLRAMDRLGKMGPARVIDDLTAAGLSDDGARRCLDLASIRGGTEVRTAVADLGVRHDLLSQGLDELVMVLAASQRRAPGALIADLSIARGLDYYTGTVFETTMHGLETAGSVCSGGRYDSLAQDGAATYPGVGISFGVSRALGLLFRRGLTASRSVPTCVLVSLAGEDGRDTAEQRAAALRARGIPTQVVARADKFGKQIRFADRRGIPFVWFVGADGAPDSVKDIRSGEQLEAAVAEWAPPSADLHPSVVAPTT